jgi:hypothetical protein
MRDLVPSTIHPTLQFCGNAVIGKRRGNDEAERWVDEQARWGRGAGEDVMVLCLSPLCAPSKRAIVELLPKRSPKGMSVRVMRVLLADVVELLEPSEAKGDRPEVVVVVQGTAR